MMALVMGIDKFVSPCTTIVKEFNALITLIVILMKNAETTDAETNLVLQMLNVVILAYISATQTKLNVNRKSAM